MPLYEYRCTKCNHKFEVHHDVGGAAGPCPVCGSPAKRVFSSVGLIFKGSGFHTTDYKKSPPAVTKEMSDSGPSDGSKSDGAAKSEKPPKTDPKPEQKADTKADTKTNQK